METKAVIYVVIHRLKDEDIGEVVRSAIAGFFREVILMLRKL